MDHLFCVSTGKVTQNLHFVVCVFHININDPLHMLLGHEKIVTHFQDSHHSELCLQMYHFIICIQIMR